MAQIKQVQKSQIDFNNIMNVSQDAIMARLNCHNIGRIIDFDATTQTCTIQLLQLKQFADEIYTPAPLVGVPLIIYGINDAFITMPNPVGSIALLFFMDRNIDTVMETGEQYTPETTRMHDFTDCIAITTFRTLNNSIQNYDTEAITLQYNKIVEDVAFTSIIKNYGNSLKLNVTNNSNINANIELSDKIKIENAQRNLKTLIQSLITTIKAITITNSAVSPASQQALENISSQFGELLQ